MSAEKAKAAEVLRERLNETPAPLRAVVGFDGFIDEIIHVVDRRESFSRFERMETMSRLAERIASAAGRSANVELVTVREKLGGNAAIMANALGRLGVGVTFIGSVGRPAVHPVFQPMGERCRIVSVAAPAHTDALEFRDGKLMLGKMKVLEELTWERIVAAAPADELAGMIGGANLLAMCNWTMLPWMSDIWKHLLEEVLPCLPAQTVLPGGVERFAFFDLADPEKRTKEDLAEALRLIQRFSERFNVILGMNEREAQQVARVLGAEAGLPCRQTDGGESAEELCRFIASKMNIHAVVVHPVDRAVAVIGCETYVQAGPYTESPLITTGAGDHFNAGFCLGRAAGLDAGQSLLLGAGCSGYYVRTAASPALPELLEFTETLG
ncbi:MAG: hypothetical protein AB1742_04450 [bacterium]